MSVINLDLDLIHRFRKKVNEEPIFRELYKNVNGKNKWNIICSAMDWITVASKGLPIINLTGIDFRLKHLITLNLMQYIICVDFLVESIVQLYRVIYNTNTYPLYDNKDVFNQSKLSDDKYFKHIRAVFSTHPVNLDSLDGVKSQDGERFYASWISEDFFKDNDFNVYLYSNDPEKDELNYFGISIEDINHYAEKRYQLLILLIEKVDQILYEHSVLYKSKIVHTDGNIFRQLEILLDENKDRFGVNNGYAGIVNYLYRMMQVELSPNISFDYSIIKEYKDFMLSLIPTIKSGLQNMEINASLTWITTSTGYEFEKVYSYLNDHKHPLGKRYFIGLVKKGILPSYLLNSDNFDEKRLFLDAVIYKEYRKRSKSISLLELVGLDCD